jgi:TetR/AcrR family transcriptional repressor of nem operon
MRYANDHKERTRQNILRSASKLFAAKGFMATSIDEVMRECQLTRGGFYAHFQSKSELYRQALGLIEPIRQSTNTIEAILQSLLQDPNDDSDEKLSFAFLATDSTCADPQVRATYSDALGILSARMAAMANSNQTSAALSTTAMLIGAMVIARTVDDESLRAKLRSACTDAANSLLANSGESLSFFWEVPDRNFSKSVAS